jgi:hypothetical protein
MVSMPMLPLRTMAHDHNPHNNYLGYGRRRSCNVRAFVVASPARRTLWGKPFFFFLRRAFGAIPIL